MVLIVRDRKEPSVRCWEVPNVRVFRVIVQEIRAMRCGAQEFCSSYCSKVPVMFCAGRGEAARSSSVR